MSKRIIGCALVLACLAAVPSAFAQSTITCGPLDDGRVANVLYKSNAIFFEPIVRYEYELAVLTISGPCEDITKTFKPGEDIIFDLAEVERVLDGGYNWELRFMPAVDAGVREELQASRGSGEEDDLWWNFWQKGLIPEGPSRESAGFTVDRGAIIDPGSGEEEGQKRATVAGKGLSTSLAAAASGLGGAGSDASMPSGGGAASGSGGNVLATKDFVINDDLIVIGSTCVGFDCVNGEVFGFDTLRLKENNLRIQFNDTSGTSFPTRNWQIRANSSSNGGQNFLAFVDQGNNDTSETGTLVFAVEAGARANALYVESDGDVGLGTSNPVLDLHISSTNTPAMRLEQTSAGGFTAQTWDIAGNEANFFVRDVTGGSRLPFRIRPGAPTSSIDIANDGDVGVGTSSPDAALDIERAGGGSAVSMIRFTNTNGPSRLEFRDNTGSVNWDFRTTSGDAFVITKEGTGVNELLLQANGNLTIPGEIFTSGSCSGGCDLVFTPDYQLESIEEHAARMWTKQHLPAVGATPEKGPFNLSKMAGGMLNELEKAHIYIEQLHDTILDLKAEVGAKEETLATLQDRLTRVEAALLEAD